MFNFVVVFALLVLMMCLVFVGFYNCYTVLIIALLVANWPFCINKLDLILFDFLMRKLSSAACDPL